MSVLNISDLSFNGLTLEVLDVFNENHLNVVEQFRDYMAVEMCYDIRCDVDRIAKGIEKNNFLVKKDENYIGYIRISDDRGGERILCYIIQEKLRGRGFGKILLTSVSDYLLNNNIASSVKLYINRKNIAGVKVASFCGFEPLCYSGGNMISYQKIKSVRINKE